MKSYRFFIYSMLWALPFTLFGQRNSGLSKHFEQQLEIFPQEKLHLHIDRTMYVPGERMAKGITLRKTYG